MSKNSWEWMIVIAIFAAFIGYCRYQDDSRQAPGGFDQSLVGAWTTTDVIQLTDGSTAPLKLQAVFNPDHTYVITLSSPAEAKPASFSGTWQLRSDPQIVAQSAGRILVTTGEPGIAGEHLTMFLGNTLNSRLMANQGEDWKVWQRVQ